METTNVETGALPPVLFGRPGKKRKAYRQRPETEDDTKARADSQAPTVLPEAVTTGDSKTDAADEEGIRSGGDGDTGSREPSNEGSDNDMDRTTASTMAELMRRRKGRRPKLGGVEFGGDDGGGAPADQDDGDRSLDLVVQLDMGMRFAPQTGHVGDVVNKHMEEYVEAQMAKRYYTDAAATDASTAGQSGVTDEPAVGASVLSSQEVRVKLAMKGKLHEIDLGAESRARNIAMTERATRQLRGSNDRAATDGDAEKDDKAVQTARPGTKASGRGGLPQKRNCRNSDDVKRDQMVEQFLHENKMDIDVYDAYAASGELAVPETAEGRPADDRVADEFRREFMDALAQRLRRKRRPLGPPPKPKTRNEEEVLRGPKLGGSRNVRSMMRDKLLQKQEEERQSKPKYEQELQDQWRKNRRR